MNKGLVRLFHFFGKKRPGNKPTKGASVLRLSSKSERNSVFRVISVADEPFDSAARAAEMVPSSSQRLGSMERRIASKELQIYAVTWNMNGEVRMPIDALSNLIEQGSDVYVIGLQEAPHFSFRETLLQILGQNYIAITKTVMGSLHLYVFAKSWLQPLISGKKVDKVKFKGFGGVVGRQKGAVAAFFSIGESSFLFISSHFSAHYGKLRERNFQYFRTRQKIFSRTVANTCLGNPALVNGNPDESADNDASSSGDLIDDCDVVIWMGDLNYRIEGSRKLVKLFLKYDLGRLLWKRDQLFNEVDKGQAFNGFVEGPLRFKPTYKYDVGTDNYDTSGKERVPSWTDRILIKVKDDSLVDLNVVNYDSIDLRASDHKPVKALLSFKNLKLDIQPEDMST